MASEKIPIKQLSSAQLAKAVASLDPRGPNAVLENVTRTWSALGFAGTDVVEGFQTDDGRWRALFPQTLDGFAALALVRKALKEGVPRGVRVEVPAPGRVEKEKPKAAPALPKRKDAEEEEDSDEVPERKRKRTSKLAETIKQSPKSLSKPTTRGTVCRL